MVSMIRKIKKFKLSSGSNILHLPKGAEVCHTGYHQNKISVWFKLDPEAPVRQTIFYVAKTDEKFNSVKYQYLSSCLNGTQDRIWHILKKVDRK